MIAAFQKENPGIKVKTNTVPYASIQTNLDSRFQANNPPDVFRVSYIDIGQYTSQDVLLDVSDTFDQATIDAFVPGSGGRQLRRQAVRRPAPDRHHRDPLPQGRVRRGRHHEGPRDARPGLVVGGVQLGRRQAGQGRQGQADALHLRRAERRRVPLADLAVRSRWSAAGQGRNQPGDRLRRWPQGDRLHRRLLPQRLGRPQHFGQEHDVPRRCLHGQPGRDGVRR